MTRFLVSASSLALILSAGTVAQAQFDHLHDEVVVTGLFADRNIDEITTNITVLDREEIVSDLRSTLGDTLDIEPGVSTTFFGAGASRPVLRGLGAERVLVLNNGVGVIDVSAASPDHQVVADGIDAERIEILRGPSALAFGGQAIGGVVNVIDGLIPEDRPDATASTFGDTPYTLEAFGAWNTAFDGPELAARGEAAFGPLVVVGSASYRDFDDYDIPGEAESDILIALEEAEGEVYEEEGEDGTLENSFVETRTLSGGASYVFDTLGEGGFIGASIRDTKSEYGLPGGHAHEEGEEGEILEPGLEGLEEEEEEESPFIDLDQTRYDVRAGVDFGKGFVSSLRASFSYADYFHTEFEAPSEVGTTYDREGWEARGQARTRLGDWVGALGFQGLSTDLVSVGEEAFISPTDTDSYAGFLYQRWRDEDSLLSLEGGVRLERTEYENVAFGDADFDLISASVGAHFHPVEPVFIGAEIAYTERALNESELFSNGVHIATRQFEVGVPDGAEERGLNYEATARYDTGPWRVGANVFYTDFGNFTTLLPGTTLFEGEVVDEVEGFPVFLFEQNDADFYGGEIYAEGEYDAGVAELFLRASLDYVRGRLDPEVGDKIDAPLLPPLTFNAEGRADFGLVGATAALTVADDQNDPGPGQLPTDGYTNLDLGAFVGLDQWFGQDGTQLFVQVRNVTDADIRYSTSTLKDFVPAPGRNLRAGLRVVY